MKTTEARFNWSFIWLSFSPVIGFGCSYDNYHRFVFWVIFWSPSLISSPNRWLNFSLIAVRRWCWFISEHKVDDLSTRKRTKLVFSSDMAKDMFLQPSSVHYFSCSKSMVKMESKGIKMDLSFRRLSIKI